MKKFMIVAFIVLLNSFNLMSAESNIVYKRIAVYPSLVPAVKVLQMALEYGWEENGTTYVFKVNQINQAEILAGKLKKYDAFVVGASGRQYIFGITELWKKRVREFISDGNGYLGICGGANIASMGYEHPENEIDHIINMAVLKVANVYINDDQDEEWQYLYKTAGIEGGVPINCILMNHPIFDGKKERIIRYEGGPGMYDAYSADNMMGKVIPIAIYGEEPSEIAPIHHWYKKNGEWHMDGNITTDIKGEYAGIVTTYGKGRIVLFGPHPEEPMIIGGHIEEFPGRSKYTFFRERYLYRWVGGNMTPWGYNWWIIRRSMAWILRINPPPINNVAAMLIVPNRFIPMIYIYGRAIMPSPINIVMGNLDIVAFANNATHVSLFVDGKELKNCDSPPYSWNIRLHGKHEIMVRAYNGNSFAYDVIEGYFM